MPQAIRNLWFSAMDAAGDLLQITDWKSVFTDFYKTPNFQIKYQINAAPFNDLQTFRTRGNFWKKSITIRSYNHQQQIKTKIPTGTS